MSPRVSPQAEFNALCIETLEIETDAGEAYTINICSGDFAGSGIPKAKIKSLRIVDRCGITLRDT